MPVCSCLKFTINTHISKVILCLKRYFLLVFSQHKHSNKQRNKQQTSPAASYSETREHLSFPCPSALCLCCALPRIPVCLRLRNSQICAQTLFLLMKREASQPGHTWKHGNHRHRAPSSRAWFQQRKEGFHVRISRSMSSAYTNMPHHFYGIHFKCL